MKILLIAGHGAGDSGAVGNGYQEQALTREVVANLAPRLSSYAEVTVYPSERNAYSDLINGQLVSYFNSNKFDYVLEIHFNSGGVPYGSGTEAYITTSEAHSTVEQEIANRLGDIFPPKRGGGVKVMDWGVIRTAKNHGMSSALVETCFINNPSEISRYVENKDAVAQAIADGVLVGFGLGNVQKPLPQPKPDAPKPPQSSVNQLADRMIAGEFGNGAEERKKNMKAQGYYNYDEVQAEVNRRYGQPQAPSRPSFIVVGSTVIVTNPVDVNGIRLGVSGTYEVMELNGSRAVIGRGGAVTAAIEVNNLKLA